MLQTYKAVYQDNKLIWDADVPEEILSDKKPKNVFVLFYDEKENKSEIDKENILEKLNSLANKNTKSSIDDPVAWQREIRKDKVLFGRE